MNRQGMDMKTSAKSIIRSPHNWLAVFAFACCLLACGCSSSDERTLPLQSKAPRQSQASAKKAAAAKTNSADLNTGTSKSSSAPAGEASAIEVVFEPAEPVTGDRLKAAIKFTNASAKDLSLTYTWLINGEKVQESSDPFLNHAIKRDDYVELQVSINGAESSDPAAGCSTFVGNAGPSLRVVNQSISETGRYQAQLEIADPERDVVQLILNQSPPGMVLDSQTNSLQWTVGTEQQGAFDVSVAARDSHGAETLLNYQIKVGRQSIERKS